MTTASTPRQHGETSGLQGLFRIVSRQRRILVIVPLVLLAVALVRSATQTPIYQGEAEVLLSRQNLANTLQGVGASSFQPAEFFQIARTQAELAHTPTVAERVIARTGVKGLTPVALLEKSAVGPNRNTDLISFTVSDPDAGRAQELADAFAREYTAYRRELDTASIEGARRGLDETLRGLDRSNADDRQVFKSLTAKEQQLRILAALQSANASVVRSDSVASQIRPMPLRDAMIALVFGLVLGGLLAFLRETIDTRVRTPEEIHEALGLQALGAVPPPAKSLQSRGRLVMLEEPYSPQAEAYRMLATSLQLTNVDDAWRVLMVSSAVESEGKSTTIGNLAVALARGGSRIALVDLDLRRPRLEGLFGLDPGPGVTHVALGDADLDDACTPISVPRARDRQLGAGLTRGDFEPALDVYRAGHIPPDPAEFIGSHAIASVLARLRERYDYVLVDCSPLLRVSDPFVLSEHVDALFLVTRLGIVRRPMLREVQRLLSTAHVTTIGFVTTGGLAGAGGYGYGYGYGYGDNPDQPRREQEASQAEFAATRAR